MNTQITARHFQATPELRTYASDRLARLEKYYDGITDARMVLEEDAQQKTAEVTLNVYRQQLAARDTGSTYEEAIDRCVRHLRRQIKRYKAKLRSKNKQVHR